MIKIILNIIFVLFFFISCKENKTVNNSEINDSTKNTTFVGSFNFFILNTYFYTDKLVHYTSYYFDGFVSQKTDTSFIVIDGGDFIAGDKTFHFEPYLWDNGKLYGPTYSNSSQSMSETDTMSVLKLFGKTNKLLLTGNSYYNLKRLEKIITFPNVIDLLDFSQNDIHASISKGVLLKWNEDINNSAGIKIGIQRHQSKFPDNDIDCPYIFIPDNGYYYIDLKKYNFEKGDQLSIGITRIIQNYFFDGYPDLSIGIDTKVQVTFEVIE